MTTVTALEIGPETGELTAETHATGHEDHGPILLGLSAEGWVYTGVTIFFVIAFVFAKAHRKILSALDQQIEEARSELERASAIRAEAETLLSGAKKQQKEAAADAKAFLKVAQEEADIVVAQAEVDTKNLISRRIKMAEEKIAAAEAAAIADVRAKAAAVSAAAAEMLIVEANDAKADAAIVDAAIATLN